MKFSLTVTLNGSAMGKTELEIPDEAVSHCNNIRYLETYLDKEFSKKIDTVVEVTDPPSHLKDEGEELHS